MNRKSKEKANNNVVELMTIHFKEFGASVSEMNELFKDLVTVVGKRAIAPKDVILLRDEEMAYKS